MFKQKYKFKIIRNIILMFIILYEMLYGISYSEEFQVNTYINDNQDNHSVTELYNDNFVICWVSENQDGNASGVYAQVFNDSCEKIGEEFQVNTHTDNDQNNPKITYISEDKFIICWESYEQDGDGLGIFAQIFSNSGDKIGEEFQVNTYSTEDQCYPKIISLSEGKFIVYWISFDQQGSGSEIFAQIFDENGYKINDEIHVNTYTKDSQYQFNGLLLSNGNFVICWQSKGQDGSWNGVYAQIFDGTGIKIGTEFQVNTYYQGDQYNPQIESLTNGNFLICWQSYEQDGSLYGVFTQIFDETGKKIGQEIQVNTYTKNDQYNHDITSLSNGNFVICWQSIEQDGSNLGIYAQIFNETGNKISDEIQVNEYINNHQHNPKIKYLSNDKFIICWNSYKQDGSSNGLYAQVYSNIGEKIGNEFRLNKYTKGQQIEQQITYISSDKILVSWESDYQDGSRTGIFAKYYLSNVISQTLSEFFIQSPKVDETIFTLSPSFNWNPANDIHINFPWEISYTLYLSEMADFSSPMIYSDILDTNITISNELNRNQIYYWRVLAHTWEGDSLWSSNVGGFFVSASAAIDDENEMNISSQFKLNQNYPNPFNPITKFSYELPTLKSSYNVVIKIFDLRGELVQLLDNSTKSPGIYFIEWNALDMNGQTVPNGVYFYTIQTDKFTETKKMLLLK